MASVTIAVPIYRNFDYLAETLEAVGAQDHADLDILVSDNGENPLEETRDRIASLLGGRSFRYRRNDRTVPICEHFNQLVAAAEGDYFVLLSDDDWISPNYASALSAHLDRDPGVAFCLGRGEVMRGDGTIQGDAKGRDFPAGVMSAADFVGLWCGHRYDFGSFVTNMARTAEIRAVGAYPDFPKGNSIDNALMLALILGREVALVDEAVFRYRIYESSTGLAADYQELADAQRLFLRHIDRHRPFREYGNAHPEVWKAIKDQVVEMVWRTYRHRWRHMYRQRLSGPEWVRAAFAMPFIPAYYRAVIGHLAKAGLSSTKRRLLPGGSRSS